MAKFDPPPKFSFRPNEWLEWIEEFGRFRTATKLHKEDGDVQRDSLLYSMGGREANRIFRTLTFVSPEKDTEYDTLVSKLTEYFIPKRNIVHALALHIPETNQKHLHLYLKQIRNLHLYLKQIRNTCTYT